MSPLPWIDLGPDAGTAPPPVGLWQLNDAGATAADVSGVGNPGTYTGTVTKGVVGPLPGTTCAEFNGTSGYVSVPTAASLHTLGAWTLSAWVYPTANRTAADSVSGLIVLNHGNVPYALAFGLNASMPGSGANRVFGGFWNSTYRTIGDPNPVVLNTWVHYAITWDGTTLRLYRDGVQVATGAPGVAPLAGTGAVYIGARWALTGASPYFPGRIWNARVYPFALTADEVRRLSLPLDPKWISSAEPVVARGRWPLDDLGASVRDLSPSRNGGTYAGTVTKGVAGPVPGSTCTEFNGTTGRVAVPASASLNAIRAAWTIAAWIYPTATRTGSGVSGPILCGEGSAAPGVPYMMSYGDLTGAIASDNRVQTGFYVNGVGWLAIADPTVAPLNTWTHFAATWADGGALRLYRNGAQVATATPGVNPVGPPNLGVVIATHFAAVAQRFPGRLWDVRLYPVTLDAQQVASLRARTGGLVGPWMPLGVAA